MSTAPGVLVIGTGAAASTWTTASFTPPANTRLVAYVSSYKATAGVALPTISDSLGTLTWTQLDDYVNSTFSNPDMRGTWFICSDVGGSPAVMTVTVASTGANSMAVMVASVLTSEVSGSTVQVVHGEDLVSGDPSATFGSAPGATNITLVGASFTGGNNSITIPSGYTSICNATHSASRHNCASYDITSAGSTIAYTSNNSRSIILGIELAPAPAGSGVGAAAGIATAAATGASDAVASSAVTGVATAAAISQTDIPTRKAGRLRINHIFLRDEPIKELPKPTKKRVQAVQKAVLSEAAGLLGHAVPTRAQGRVRSEVKQAYTPQVDPGELEALLAEILRLNIQRINDEIEAEDEEILLMAI